MKMMNAPRSGAVAVFLVIVLSAFVAVAALLFMGAKSAAGRSIADGALQSAGRSVLSEYDNRLLKDYGILAFKGDEASIEKDIKFYADAALSPRDPFYALIRKGGSSIRTVDTRVEDAEASLKEYSLLDLDNFEDQIRTASLTGRALIGGPGGSGGAGGDSGTPDEDKDNGRVLRKDSVIDSLPSEGYSGPVFPSFSGIPDLVRGGDPFKSGTTAFLVNEYALNLFGNRLNAAPRDEHFFRNEVEYLIAGYRSDDSNYSSIKMRLRVLFAGLNEVSLHNDAAKMAICLEIGGPLAVAAGLPPEVGQEIVAGVWVSGETENDINLLEAGKKVSLFKTQGQWATQNIVDIWNGWTDGSLVEPADGSGLNYKDYLRVLLFMLDRETKLLRMMDLMQINLKGTYAGDFLMREYYIGYRFSCTVDGDTYEYIEKY
ncbi:MAG: DUF5702 domain-containing protein [Clostridiales Family XIII bacterium]|jgi:hypothetical protein|nr:DUF5702 domain-containing protein [Clostridiales Family XIII bacterium]